MRLTKEEEVQIVVSGEDKAEMLEQCALSMVGRLLTNRKQNQRALKNTLRLAWKASLDLRIVKWEMISTSSNFQMNTSCNGWKQIVRGIVKIIYYFFKDGKE